MKTLTACDRDPARCACATHTAARAAAAPCIYCGAPGPTNDSCACAACAMEMGMDVPAPPKRRCPDCGEFAEDCEGHGHVVMSRPPTIDRPSGATSSRRARRCDWPSPDYEGC